MMNPRTLEAFGGDIIRKQNYILLLWHQSYSGVLPERRRERRWIPLS